MVVEEVVMVVVVAVVDGGGASCSKIQGPTELSLSGVRVDASSHDHLFGPPTPAIVKKLRRIEQVEQEGRGGGQGRRTEEEGKIGGQERRV